MFSVWKRPPSGALEVVLFMNGLEMLSGAPSPWRTSDNQIVNGSDFKPLGARSARKRVNDCQTIRWVLRTVLMLTLTTRLSPSSFLCSRFPFILLCVCSCFVLFSILRCTTLHSLYTSRLCPLLNMFSIFYCLFLSKNKSQLLLLLWCAACVEDCVSVCAFVCDKW